MPNLNTLLQKCASDDERDDFIDGLFEILKKKVNAVLLFGPCNNEVAEKADSTYYYKKQNQDSFFSIHYQEDELAVLPAVIANTKRPKGKLKDKSVAEVYQAFLKDCYLYGTGTCQHYAILGAYFLAKEFEVELSIETIFSSKSHTYIRLHTNPEYVMDFWSPMFCEYDNTTEWNEFFGSTYMRNKDSTYRQDLKLTSTQLTTMSSGIFSETNKKQRLAMIEEVMAEAEKERALDQPEELSSSDKSGMVL